ncbi:hydroxymethylpyrimidine/phosphomethylpyrimidine kinase [Exilibacterium tricleocarpae]|uniref:hydroxymethylpyrimidine kinase n=1 Tax=Exilibacterium tricleocarpae TaxID=2591008 RepID=A0A545T3A8_9GAMM|nr:hydroxymethylpyrimidine/phosphomethylpyrimidine kinase [Exilibacterium tricleocarpae]TQV71711.1 hydroxymethylpyrimidine/phosphomethylpyrimidine kinase [Exilibacterium tricleocarpae]
MTQFDCTTPVVMSFSNHDPSGGTGIQADIETTASLGCHSTPIVTALCAKDTRDLKDVLPVETPLLIEQARAILEDMPVKAIKVGFTGSVENIEAMHTILRDYPKIPVVLHPVTSFCHSELLDAPAIIHATQALLLPLATIVTPNLVEAHDLAQQADTIDACAQEILDSGCRHLLISGTKRSHNSIESSLYGPEGLVKHYRKERLQACNHGCGATLSAAIAAYLAHGLRLVDAVEQGQNFAWHALAGGRRLGMGNRIPNRMYWADRNSDTLNYQTEGS